MAAQAKYTIMVPTHDNQGNQLIDLATVGHQYLFNAGKIEGSFIEPGKKSNWRDDPQETFDHLVIYAEDTPEMDSHMKQLAVHIAELANQWGVTITKDGAKGPNLWVIDNPAYKQGMPADPSAIAPPPPQMELRNQQPTPTVQHPPTEMPAPPQGLSLARSVSAVDYLDLAAFVQ